MQASYRVNYGVITKVVIYAVVAACLPPHGRLSFCFSGLSCPQFLFLRSVMSCCCCRSRRVNKMDDLMHGH
uniref:Uncharacterized protein n=1 Tax=Hordeum vulgare subsp. vulgare TaxID=112509 RepID=A0A8I6Z4F9_HORVV